MAQESVRSKKPHPAGIPLAFRRTIHRSAQSNPSFEKEGFLSFVQKGENFPCPHRSGETSSETYPHDRRGIVAIGG
jgi:hypothetical protein